LAQNGSLKEIKLKEDQLQVNKEVDRAASTLGIKHKREWGGDE
jgi:hypothetical protein